MLFILDFKNFKRYFSYISSFIPLRFWGFVSLLAALISLLYLAKDKSDLVANVFGISLLGLLIIFLVILLIYTPYIKKNLKILNHDLTAVLFSKRNNSAGFSIHNLRLPYFFSLSIERIFDDSGAEHRKTVCLGSFSLFRDNNYNNVITDTLYFPNRGEYQFKGYEIIFGDNLGLTSHSWLIKNPLTYPVHPPSVQIEPLPIMAASSQIGDTNPSSKHRTGDLFDIRAYQPGDSLKRIIWKVYARTGDLVVRQPEPAMVPEGEVSVFIFAEREDDIVASAALSYLKNLKNQNILFNVGVSGEEESISNNIEDTEKIIIKSAQSKLSQDGSFKKFIELVKGKSSELDQVIFFFSERFLLNSVKEIKSNQNKNSSKTFKNIISIADQNNITLHGGVVPCTLLKQQYNHKLIDYIRSISTVLNRNQSKPNSAYYSNNANFPDNHQMHKVNIIQTSW